MSDANERPKLKAKTVVAFVRDIHAGNFDVAAIFADWLVEGGYPKQGLLLRRRWRRWQREREKEVVSQRAQLAAKHPELREAILEAWSTPPGYIPGDDADLSFRRYVQNLLPLSEFEGIERKY